MHLARIVGACFLLVVTTAAAVLLGQQNSHWPAFFVLVGTAGSAALIVVQLIKTFTETNQALVNMEKLRLELEKLPREIRRLDLELQEMERRASLVQAAGPEQIRKLVRSRELVDPMFR